MALEHAGGAAQRFGCIAQLQVRSAKQEWRDSGPTDRGPTKGLEKSFDALIAKIQSRLDAQYTANLEQKQSLIKQAQRLESTTDLAQAASDVKRLQNAWREIGLTPHAEGQRLWEEFKALCDAVFEKRRAQHTERVTELKQSESQAIALCEEAEALAKRTGAEIFSGAARLRELRDAFSAVADLPRESAQSIQRRFKKAVDQFERVGGFECCCDGEVVGVAPAREDRLVRVPTTPDEVADGDPLRCDRRLRQQPELTGQFLRSQAVR